MCGPAGSVGCARSGSRAVACRHGADRPVPARVAVARPPAGPAPAWWPVQALGRWPGRGPPGGGPPGRCRPSPAGRRARAGAPPAARALAYCWECGSAAGRRQEEARADVGWGRKRPATPAGWSAGVARSRPPAAGTKAPWRRARPRRVARVAPAAGRVGSPDWPRIGRRWASHRHRSGRILRRPGHRRNRVAVAPRAGPARARSPGSHPDARARTASVGAASGGPVGAGGRDRYGKVLSGAGASGGAAALDS